MISGEDDNTLHTDNYDVGVKLSQFCEQSDDTPSNEKINEEQFSDYYSCEELHESNIEDASSEKPSESFLDDEPLDNPYDSVDEILGSDNEDHESGISAEKEKLLPSDPKESGPDINNISEDVLKVSEENKDENDEHEDESVCSFVKDVLNELNNDHEEETVFPIPVPKIELRKISGTKRRIPQEKHIGKRNHKKSKSSIINLPQCELDLDTNSLEENDKIEENLHLNRDTPQDSQQSSQEPDSDKQYNVFTDYAFKDEVEVREFDDGLDLVPPNILEKVNDESERKEGNNDVCATPPTSPNRDMQRTSCSSKEENSRKLYGCPFANCREYFSTKLHLVLHYLKVHQDSNLTMTLVTQVLPDHSKMSETSPFKIRVPGENKVRSIHYCHVCLASFSLEAKLSSHLKLHEKTETYRRCEHCKNFFQVKELRYHLRNCIHVGEEVKIKLLKD